MVVVLLFMVAYYRLPGLLADIALIIYIILLMGAIKLVNQVLTLPGILAVIISIGMAVDANIIIFERLKEEIRTGKTLRSAVEAAFKRAWTAILDSNVCSIGTGAGAVHLRHRTHQGICRRSDHRRGGEPVHRGDGDALVHEHGGRFGRGPATLGCSAWSLEEVTGNLRDSEAGEAVVDLFRGRKWDLVHLAERMVHRSPCSSFSRGSIFWATRGSTTASTSRAAA